jgi:dienelactone hydrolase
MKMKALFLVVCILGLVACGGGGGDGSGGGGSTSTVVPLPILSAGQQGVINFDSVNADSYSQLVSKSYSRTPVGIFGTLYLPNDLTSKVPAMVIAHGTGGVSDGREIEWAEYLANNGIAGFVVDSFTPRGIGSGGIDPGSVNSSVSVADALIALELLATHPDIDASRIGVMGGSRGGNVAYATAFEEARASIISSTLKFVAHVPFYPNCNVRRWSPHMTGAPMLFLLAELDDLTPSTPCVNSFIPSLTGASVMTKVYSGVYHGFDSGSALAVINTDAYGKCAGEERLDIAGPTRFSNFDTHTVFSSGADYTNYVNSCVAAGGNMAHFGKIDDTAEDQAKIDLLDFLTAVFNL